MNAANHEASELDLACEKIRQLLSAADLDDAFARYNVGTIVQRVKSDPRTFGDNGVDRLKSALAIGRSSLYRHARVAQRWDEVSFLSVLELRTHSGARLSWRHLELLAEVADDERLHSLIETTLMTDLTARQLARLVRAGRPTRQWSSRDSVEEAISRFTREAAALTERLQPLQGTPLMSTMLSLLDRCHEGCGVLTAVVTNLSAGAKRSKVA